MTEWAPKRFWAEAAVEPAAAGFAVRLDARRLNTPAKAPLILPTAALATAIAAEWGAQADRVVPQTMPMTRLANSALDRVAPQRAAVSAVVAAYAETDLVCYRADRPAALAARQAEAWDPLLGWAAETLGAPLRAVVGLMPRPQPRESIARLATVVAGTDAFRLAALHELTALSGSLILGLAVLRGHLDPDAGWALSRIDEDWQIAQWGADAEAADAAAAKAADFAAAARFHALLEDCP